MRKKVIDLNTDFYNTFLTTSNDKLLAENISLKKRCESLLESTKKIEEKTDEDAAQNSRDAFELQQSYFRIILRLATVSANAGGASTTDSANTLQQALASPFLNDEQRLKLRVNLGNVYLSLGTFSEALKHYRISIDQVSKNNVGLRTKILRNISAALIQAGKHEEAVEAIRSVAKVDSDYRDYYNLMLCLQVLGDRENMSRAFMHAIRIPQKTIPGEVGEDIPRDDLDKEIRRRREISRRIQHSMVTMAGELMSNDELSDLLSRSSFKNLNADTELSEVKMLIEKNKIAKAKERLSMIETTCSNPTESFLSSLSALRIITQDFEKANELVKRILQRNPTCVSALNNKACLLVKEGNPEEALEALQNVVHISGANSIPRYNISIVYRSLGRYHDAEKHLLALVKGKNGMKLNQVFLLADTYYAMGKLEEAVSWSELLISTPPSDPTTRYLHGLICFELGRKEDALASMKESYALDPKSIDTIDWLGSYYVEMEDFQSAIAIFKRAVQAIPTVMRFRLLLGSCYRSIGSHEKAKKIYTEAHERFPNNAECVKHIISLYKNMKQTNLIDRYVDKLYSIENDMEE